MVSRMKSQEGFTLIELVAIIVILGILAAVAVPRFISLRDDADRAHAKAVLGALNSTASIVFAKHVLGTTNVCGEGPTINTAKELAACLDGGLPDNWSISGSNFVYNAGGTKHTFRFKAEVANTSRARVATDDTQPGKWP